MKQNIDLFLQSVRSEIERVLPRVLAGRNSRTQKEDGSYVTQGDFLVQETLLALIEQFLPGAEIVSEEMPVQLNGTILPEFLVVIDPIDGTENFTSGLPEWGISISCYYFGIHASSLIACPQMGLWLNSGDIIERFESRIRGLSSSLNKDELLAATQGYEYRILGCCVYNMLNVIRGSFSSFENPKGASSWDILAGLNLALENQLNVIVEGTIYAGEYLAPTRKYRFKIENQ